MIKKEVDFQVEEFTKFYNCLMSNAPYGYRPWFFPCAKNGKNPCPQAILNINPESKGSWHHESARLNKEQCIEHIKKGYNIGISARNEDPLIIGDIDEAEFMNQMPKDTLTQTSRKRCGGHFFGWDKDGSAKINLPTDFGELRSSNQYVLACGSYVPFDLKNEKDKKAFDKLTKEAQEDILLGFYTIRDEVEPRLLSFNDVPDFFRNKQKENISIESEIGQRDEKKEYTDKEGKYTELFKLKVSDIIGLTPSNKRIGHPLHESDTDANWSLSIDGSIGHCWRHLVSLNAVQYLCVMAGYSKCEDAGTPHSNRGTSKIRGDKNAFEIAYNEALKLGLIKKKKKEREEVEDVIEISKIVDDENKIIVEQVYDKKNGCRFCIYNDYDKSIKYDKQYIHNGIKYYPIVGEEISKGAVLLPSEALEYETDEDLDNEIYAFANRWLDAKMETMRFGVWNVKVSYVYENFHTLNYLRVQGDTGTGKTRYLDVWGHLHYKPIFTTGTTTPAPLFRIIDKWRGTVVMDEADLRNSDESEQIIKILNNGFEKGKFIMRCDQNDAKKLSFFDPFCPKILSTRRSFQDKATESRCITSISSVTNREDIPLNLNDDFFNDALRLRNKLLMWRFRNYFNINKNVDYDLGDIEPRVKQIVGSYISLFSTDEEQMQGFKKYINNYQNELIVERQSSFDGSIVGAIHRLLNKGINDFDSKDVIQEGGFTDRNGKEMQPRGLTSYLKSLGFKNTVARKVDGKTKRCIPIEQEHIDKLFKRYGYEVTVVTVVTDSSMINNEGINGVINAVCEESGANRIYRNNRNSVTEKEVSEEPLNKSLPTTKSPQEMEVLDNNPKCPKCSGLTKKGEGMNGEKYYCLNYAYCGGFT